MSLIITAGHFRRAVHLNRRGPIPFEFDDRCRGDKNWDREKPSDTEGEAGWHVPGLFDWPKCSRRCWRLSTRSCAGVVTSDRPGRWPSSTVPLSLLRVCRRYIVDWAHQNRRASSDGCTTSFHACGQSTVNKWAPIHYVIPINDMVHRSLLNSFKKLTTTTQIPR